MKKVKGVQTLKDGRHYIGFKRGCHPEDSTRTREYFPRGEEGYRQAVKRHAELFPPGGKPSGGIQFNELANQYSRAKQNYSSASDLDRLFWTLKSLVNPFLGAERVDKLTHQHFHDYINWRRKKVKMTTIHKDLSIVRAILNWGVEQKLISASPFAGFKMPKRDDAVIQPPSHAEYLQVVRCAAEHVRRAMLIAYYTGIRPGPVELYSLTWRCYDRGTGVITVISADKGGIPVRDVPVHPHLKAQMDLWKTKDDDIDGYIINWRGKPVKTIKTAWKAAFANAKVQKRFRPYSLRHKSISDMLAAGADLKSVSEIVGHSDPNMTLSVYQKTTSKTKKAAINKLLGTTTSVVPSKKPDQEYQPLRRVK